jgi:hypothetical protein
MEPGFRDRRIFRILRISPELDRRIMGDISGIHGMGFCNMHKEGIWQFCTEEEG